MKLHLDMLAWLHIIWGALGVLAGASLLVLAAGTELALLDLGGNHGAGGAALALFLIFGFTFAAGGLAFVIVGRSLLRRAPFGRPAALLLAWPNLIFVPFGPALSAYAFWALLNDDARRAFE